MDSHKNIHIALSHTAKTILSFHNAAFTQAPQVVHPPVRYLHLTNINQINPMTTSTMTPIHTVKIRQIIRMLTSVFVLSDVLVTSTWKISVFTINGLHIKIIITITNKQCYDSKQFMYDRSIPNILNWISKTKRLVVRNDASADNCVALSQHEKEW